MLFSSSAKLQAVLSTAITTNPLAVVASWADIAANASTLAPLSSSTSLSTTAPVDIIDSPSAGQRQVKFVNIFNADTVSATVTVQLVDGANTRKLLSVTVPAGGRIEFTPEGWRVFNADGAEVSSGGGGGATSWYDISGIPSRVVSVETGGGASVRVGEGAYLASATRIATIDGASYLRYGYYGLPSEFPSATTQMLTGFSLGSPMTGAIPSAPNVCIEGPSGSVLFFSSNGTVHKLSSSRVMAQMAALAGLGGQPLSAAKIGTNTILCTYSSSPSVYAYSADGGDTWSTKSLPSAGNYIIVSNGSRVIALLTSSSSTGYYTDDGINWTSFSMPSAQNWEVCAYGSGLFVAVAYASNTTVAATSPDGITWTARTKPAIGVAASAVKMAYMFGKFYVFYSAGINAQTTADGVTWNTITQPATNINRIGYYPSYSCGVVSTTGAAYYSLDGANWASLSNKQNGATSPGAAFGIYYDANLREFPMFPVVSTEDISLYKRIS